MELRIRYLKNYNLEEWGELKYAYHGDSGFDIRAAISEDIILKPGDSYFFKTGISFVIPFGYEIMIRSRSGLSNKKQIMMLNGVGTVDSQYRGEVRVGLINMGKNEYTIKSGERIAQCVVQAVIPVKFIKINFIIGDTERGKNGFGSSGKL